MFPDLDFDLALEQLPVIDIAASLTLVVLLLLIRLAAGQAIWRLTDAAPYLQRRWTANIRNLLLFLALLGLVLIWAPQLRTFALSLTAVAVAVVVATKELILCFSGSLMRASSRALLGGRLDRDRRRPRRSHRSFVTKLHEFERGRFNHTGRTTVLPNSVFLNLPMRNDSLMRDYAYHEFSLTLDPQRDIFAKRAAIEEIVARHHAPLSDAAARANALVEERFHVDLMDAPVRVSFRTTDLGKYRIGITLFCPTQLAETLENNITCEVMSYLHGLPDREGRETREQTEAGDRDIRTDGDAGS